MTNDLLTKIDTLIEMSKSTSNYDTLKAEKSENEKELEAKRKEMEDLQNSMQDEKYMKASDRIIDENIKVSLELKIQKLESNHKKLEEDLKKKIQEESNAHDFVIVSKEKVERLEKLIHTLHEKMEMLKDDEIKEHYERLLKTDEEKLEASKQTVSESEENYRHISRELTTLTEQLEKLQKEINGEKEKLKSTVQNLSTNESYIDKDRKAEDEKRLEELENKLKELETRQEEIEKDPVLIGNIAKELYLEEDYTGSLKKVIELVEYIKTLPYMDITSSFDIEKILKEAEKRAIAERDAFASVIENKKYNGSDTQIVEEREKYLEAKKQELQDDLASMKNRLKRMDTTKFQELNALLSAATVVQENLKKDLEDYKRVIKEEEETATPKKKTTLLAALKKKEEELETVGEIIHSYENEIEELMMESKKLEEEKIKTIEEKIAETDEAMKEIEKKVVVSSKANDILALESDKTKLKELNDTIKAIAERKKYNKTPSELLDEIEMLLGSPDDIQEEPKEEVEPEKIQVVEDIDLPKEPVLPPIIEETNPIEEVFEVNVETEKEQEEKSPKKETEEVNPVKVEDFIPKRKEETPVVERYRVIDIESLDEEPKKEVEPPKQSAEDDFIDFDAIVGGNGQ